MDATDRTDVMVRARGLVKRFGEFTAVDGIDVEIQRGEAFGFLGPNGAGKSSTMRMIGCVSPPTAGELTVLGRDPQRDGAAIRARLGVVPQQDSLDTELTVLDNLLIYARFFGLSRAHARAKAIELLDFAQLADRADSIVEPLSGGMKRRLTIARALVNEPELLLLDEPTTGLDPQARHVLWDRLFRLKQQGVTLVLTTHYMDEAEQLCDRLVVMDGGRIVAEGSPRSLIEQWSTREVLELRFAADDHAPYAAKVRPGRRPGRGAARPAAALRGRRRGGAAGGAAARARPDLLAGPAQQPGGRVPAADRPDAGGLRWPTSSSPPPAGLGRRRGVGRSGTAGRRCGCSSLHLLAWRRLWRGTVFTSFLQPLLFFVAIGYGLGSLVGRGGRLVDGVPYLAFVAPGMMAAAAMQTAIGWSTWPVLVRDQVAAPVPRDARRRRSGSPTSCWATCSMWPCGCWCPRACSWASRRRPARCRSWTGIVALAAAILVGLAFAAPVFAFTTHLENDAGFNILFRLVMIPLFLFSGTFFPIGQLPALLEGIARVTPLWHGVELARDATLGRLAVADLGHTAYLLVWVAVGTWLAVDGLRRRMAV